MNQPSLKTLLLPIDSTMSTKIKFLARFLVLTLCIILVSFFSSCEKDLQEDLFVIEQKYSSQKKSFDQVLLEINSIEIKNFAKMKSAEDLVFYKQKVVQENDRKFLKINKKDDYTTYSLVLNNYSKAKPFFSFLIITKKGNTEKAGIVRFIPLKPTIVFNEKTFTGTFQMYDIYNTLVVEDQILNGQIKKGNKLIKNASKSSGCTTTILTIIRACSHGGEHTPGGTCATPFVNDSYYEYISITTTCISSPTYERIAAPDSFAGQGNVIGGGSTLTNILAVQLFLYDLTADEYAVITANPGLISYLDQNDGSLESREFAYWVILSTLFNNEKFQPLLTFLNETNYIAASISFTKEMANIQFEVPTTSLNTLFFVIEAQKQGKIDSNIDEVFLESVSSYVEVSMVDPVVTAQLVTYYNIQCAVLKYKHPTWTKRKIKFMAALEFVHIGLDIFGLVPVGGEVADMINGTLYTLTDDDVNAAFSFASAVPGAGWAAVGVKYSIKLKTASVLGTKVLLTWKVLADGTIYFGSNNTCRAQLRKALGMVVGNLNQAHHIIPLNKQTKSIVQKAAKSGNAFHLNEALNGIPLSTAVHNGSNANYDLVIQTKFDQFNASNATPDECYNFLNDLIQDVRTWIVNNPNTPINQIILP